MISNAEFYLLLIKKKSCGFWKDYNFPFLIFL